MTQRSRIFARLNVLYITKVHRGRARCYSTTTSGDGHGESQIDTKNNSQQQAPTQAFHKRKYGNQALPLSSFLDPLRIDQRHQHRNRKPKPAPPVYKDLDAFRQKLGRNPYAQLLAQPVRSCVLTGAHLPQSLLLNLKEMPDADAFNAKKFVPLTLFNKSVRRLKDEDVGPVTKGIGIGQSIALNRRLIQWLADYSESFESLRGVLVRYEAKMPPNIVRVVDELLADLVTTSVRWPLDRCAKNFVSLPAGLDDLSACQEPIVILFFGGRVYSKQIAKLEARADAIFHNVDSLIHKTQIGLAQLKSNPMLTRVVRRADPRALHSPTNLSTVKFDVANGDAQQQYSVPIIPMVDLLGEKCAKELLADTAHEGAVFLAVESSQSMAKQVALLLSCAMWAKEGHIDKMVLRNQD